MSWNVADPFSHFFCRIFFNWRWAGSSLQIIFINHFYPPSCKTINYYFIFKLLQKSEESSSLLLIDLFGWNVYPSFIIIYYKSCNSLKSYLGVFTDLYKTDGFFLEIISYSDVIKVGRHKDHGVTHDRLFELGKNCLDKIVKPSINRLCRRRAVYPVENLQHVIIGSVKFISID